MPWGSYSADKTVDKRHAEFCRSSLNVSWRLPNAQRTAARLTTGAKRKLLIRLTFIRTIRHWSKWSKLAKSKIFLKDKPSIVSDNSFSAYSEVRGQTQPLLYITHSKPCLHPGELSNTFFTSREWKRRKRKRTLTITALTADAEQVGPHVQTPAPHM